MLVDKEKGLLFGKKKLTLVVSFLQSDLTLTQESVVSGHLTSRGGKNLST